MIVVKLLPFTHSTIAAVSHFSSPPCTHVTRPYHQSMNKKRKFPPTGNPTDCRYAHNTTPVYLHYTNTTDKRSEKEEETVFNGNNNGPRKSDEILPSK